MYLSLSSCFVLNWCFLSCAKEYPSLLIWYHPCTTLNAHSIWNRFFSHAPFAQLFFSSFRKSSCPIIHSPPTLSSCASYTVVVQYCCFLESTVLVFLFHGILNAAVSTTTDPSVQPSVFEFWIRLHKNNTSLVILDASCLLYDFWSQTHRISLDSIALFGTCSSEASHRDLEGISLPVSAWRSTTIPYFETRTVQNKIQLTRFLSQSLPGWASHQLSCIEGRIAIDPSNFTLSLHSERRNVYLNIS